MVTQFCRYVYYRVEKMESRRCYTQEHMCKHSEHLNNGLARFLTHMSPSDFGYNLLRREEKFYNTILIASKWIVSIKPIS